jgi:hypothetical protein
LRLAALAVEARWLATGPNVSAEVRVRLLQLAWRRQRETGQ